MRTADMPFCCGALVIGAFGGGEYYSPAEAYAPSKIGLVAMKRELNGDLLRWKKTGVKIVFATTTTNQPWAEEMLTEAGFYTHERGAPTSRGDDGARKIYGWFLPLQEYPPEKEKS